MNRPKPWREWTTVERADLYSTVSLVGLMWMFPVAVFLERYPTTENHQHAVGVALFLLYLLGLATWLLVWPPSRWRTRDRKRPPRWLLVCLYTVNGFYILDMLRDAFNERSEEQVTLVGTSAFIIVWLLGTETGRWPTVAAFAIGLIAPIGLTGRPVAGLMGLIGAGFCLFATRSSVWLRTAIRDLDAARTAQADLAVAEERLRFSRDVHDVLGRRLSAIALQAELAARLSERGDTASPRRMLEVRATAHEALREARELARGYRPVDLGQEVDGARSLLAAAGIELDAQLNDVPEPAHEAAAWVVRETLTNVLRHSDATKVTLTWRSPWLVVVNDRPNPASDASDGAGLTGLEERLSARGGALETARDHDYFTVRARLPLEDRAPVRAGAP